MNRAFRSLIASLHSKLEKLQKMSPVTIANLPKRMPCAGIYLFSEKGRYLYVGRSKTIRSRLYAHCRPSANHYSATFAFLIARKRTDRRKATYREESSRAMLERDPVFAGAFRKAKASIRNMDIRFVEESDPLKQALLEIYVAVALKTPYNDFDTH